MEYLTVGLLIIAILLLVVLLFKRSDNLNLVDRISSLEKNVTKELGDFKYDFSAALKDDFDRQGLVLEKRLHLINEKVNERLDVNFERTNKTFANVLERLGKIDEAQKKIDGLSTDIVSLQSILTDKKTRGIFGETNLAIILSSIFGEKNDSIYRLQYGLSNGNIVDAILFAPKPLGTIGIDSKFPLEHYEIMCDRNLTRGEREEAFKLFKVDVKKHIDAIASKYIIRDETSSQAIMFLPAEAIFAEINAYHQDLLNYAYKKRVWITSPTTLMSTLTIISMIIKDMERDKYAQIIHDELTKLSVEFGRYKERWDHLAKSIETVNKDVLSIYTTTDKITKRFESINNVEIKNDHLIENREE